MRRVRLCPRLGVGAQEQRHGRTNGRQRPVERADRGTFFAEDAPTRVLRELSDSRGDVGRGGSTLGRNRRHPGKPTTLPCRDQAATSSTSLEIYRRIYRRTFSSARRSLPSSCLFTFGTYYSRVWRIVTVVSAKRNRRFVRDKRTPYCLRLPFS